MENAEQTTNSKCKIQEKEAKEDNKRRREEQSAEEADALVCPEKGCTFMTQITSSLENHCRQRHCLLLSVVCSHYQESFTSQGIHNQTK